MQSGRTTKSMALFALAVALLAGTHSPAQVATASINGTILDESGAVISGATIVATQVETNYSKHSISGDTGAFTLPSLPVGPYRVTAEKSGFGKYEQSGILLTVGQIATLQISLRVGTESQSVTVTAEAPAVESTQSTIQSVVEEKVVSDLPLNGRNPATLMNTVPGVTDATLNISGTTSNISNVKEGDATLSSQSAPTTNGVRPGGTYFSLDGAGNVDPFEVIGGPFPNPDATQEFAVVTGSYGARYVSAPGGAVNIVTKSGTNQFHGSVFEFLRNGFFNARNDFSQTPDILKRNQFGAAVGGPVLKDKLFYFGSYQGGVIHNTQAAVSVVPTNDERNGLFTSAITGSPVQIPGFLQSATALNALKYIPKASSGAYAYYNSPANSTENQFIGKADYNLGSNRIFARYFSDHNTVPAYDMANNNVFTTQPGGEYHDWDAVALGNTWASKAGNWVSDTHASFLRVHIVNYATKGDEKFGLPSLGATNFTPGVHPGMPLLIANFVAATPSWTQFPRNSWDFQEDVLHTAGKHEISFGADIRFLHYKEYNESGQNGVAIFTGVASTIMFGPLVDGVFADLLMGHPTVFIQHDGFITSSHGNMAGFYGEDKYRLTDRATLTGGLRWDPYFPFIPESGRIDCWTAGSQSTVFVNAPKGILYPGESGGESGGTPAKYNVIQPRVGLAYRMDKSGSTALRAGWGMYSMQFPLTSFLGFSAPPWVRNYQTVNPFQSLDNVWGSNGMSDPFSGGFHDASYMPAKTESFAAETSSGMAVGAIDRNFRPAYVEQWTLSLQRAITAADSIELAYVGTEGVHLSQSADIDLPVYGSGASVSNENSRRPYASEGLTNIYRMESNTNSSYNGLNATFHHRNRGGLDLVSGFNWSKCMDDGSQPPTTANQTILESDPRHFHGRCDYDQNYSFRNTVVWTSPGLKNANHLAQSALASWTGTGLIVADAGQPMSVTDSADNSYTNSGFDRADRVSGVPLHANGHLNRAAFTDNAPGTFGNSGRNSFRSPSNLEVDFGMMKAFDLRERLKLNFRAEAFNLFNHPNMAPPLTEYNGSTAGTFGRSTAARDPRILQFSLKMQF